MKKTLIVGIVLALLGGIVPGLVLADCPDVCCCYCNVTRYYNVSYFNENHDWVTDRVEAWNGREAAEDLGLRAGYDCFVGFSGIEYETRTFWYKVSYFDEGHNWVTEHIKAEDREGAVEKVSPDGGYFVSRAVGYEESDI